MEMPNTSTTTPTLESLSQSLNEACEAQDRYFTAAQARIEALTAKVRDDQHTLACLEDEPWLVSLVKFTARNGDTIAGSMPAGSLPAGSLRSQVEAFSRDARIAVGACK